MLFGPRPDEPNFLWYGCGPGRRAGYQILQKKPPQAANKRILRERTTGLDPRPSPWQTNRPKLPYLQFCRVMQQVRHFRLTTMNHRY